MSIATRSRKAVEKSISPFIERWVISAISSLIAGIGGDFVQGLAGDDRAVHVRHEHGLAPAAEFCDEHVHRLMVQHHLQLGDVGDVFDDELSGLAGGEPVEVLAGAKIFGAGGVGLGERSGLPVGDENDDMGHGRDW